MAKGRYAVKAAKRRVAVLDEMLSKTTETMVDAKIRARQAEAAAKETETLRARVRQLEQQLDDDTVMVEVLEKMHAYARNGREWQNYHRELNDAMFALGRDVVRLTGVTGLDLADYLAKRFPGLFANGPRKNPGLAKLSPEALHRLEQAQGKKAILPKGMTVEDLIDELGQDLPDPNGLWDARPKPTT